MFTTLVVAVERFVFALARLMNAAAGWVYVLMAFFVTMDIVTRQFFGFNSKSTTEMSGYMLAFGMSWALAQTMIDRAHIRIDVLVNRLPLRLRQLLHLFSLILLTAFVAFLAWGAFSLVNESLIFKATDISALAVPLIIPQGLWTFGVAFFLLLLLLFLIKTAALLAGGRANEVDRLLGSRGYEEETAEALEAAGVSAGRSP